jgi:acyl carrier protein
MHDSTADSALVIARGILAKNSGGRVAAEAIQGDLRLSGDLGIDSLKFILVILEIDEQLGRKVFNVDNVTTIVTVGDLYKLLQGGQ